MDPGRLWRLPTQQNAKGGSLLALAERLFVVAATSNGDSVCVCSATLWTTRPGECAAIASPRCGLLPAKRSTYEPLHGRTIATPSEKQHHQITAAPPRLITMSAPQQHHMTTCSRLMVMSWRLPLLVMKKYDYKMYIGDFHLNPCGGTNPHLAVHAVLHGRPK